MLSPPPTLIQPGDCCLYEPTGVVGWVISMKTWHEVAHCECYVGASLSVASRDGHGVNTYPLRTDNLCEVLRPRFPFDLAAADDWFTHKAIGQAYDWLGLVRFAWRAPVSRFRYNNKMFCSEFLTRFYRAGGLDPFNGGDADAIAPFEFAESAAFTTIWRKP